MQTIEDYTGKKHEVECLGCQHAEEGENAVGYIYQTDHFHAHQDTEIPIPGFMILASKRHFLSIDEMTNEEWAEYMEVLVRLRRGMREALGIETVYFFQNEEDDHHFHVWLFPRYDWMEKFGKKIESVRPIMKHAREHMKTKENIKQVNEAAEKMRRWMI